LVHGACFFIATPARVKLLARLLYWCPEQIMGRPQDAPLQHLFLWAALLYEMLTGQSPFPRRSIQAVCTRVLSSAPLPPSQTNSSLPQALDEVVAKCLMKDPAFRPASGGRARRASPILSGPAQSDGASRAAAQQQTRSATAPRDFSARLVKLRISLLSIPPFVVANFSSRGRGATVPETFFRPEWSPPLHRNGGNPWIFLSEARTLNSAEAGSDTVIPPLVSQFQARHSNRLSLW